MDASASVIVVGYAKVPATAASHATSEFFTVNLRIDRRSGTVVEVDCTAMTGLVQRWLSELLTGADFTADIAPILNEIETIISARAPDPSGRRYRTRGAATPPIGKADAKAKDSMRGG